MDPRIHRRAEHVAPSAPKTSIAAGSVWMVAISLVLFFLPLVNGLIGGAVGGYKVGGVGRALKAAILPSVVVAVGLWLMFALLEAPVWGMLAGATAALLVALADLGMFLGAAIGGALSPPRTQPLSRVPH